MVSSGSSLNLITGVGRSFQCDLSFLLYPHPIQNVFFSPKNKDTYFCGFVVSLLGTNKNFSKKKIPFLVFSPSLSALYFSSEKEELLEMRGKKRYNYTFSGSCLKRWSILEIAGTILKTPRCLVCSALQTPVRCCLC